jgi:hypothetical protein
MNTQERDQLNLLLKQLIDFKISTKDAEAEALIRDAVAHQPDTAYLLIQRVMLLEHGLNNAKARIDELQRQVQSAQSGQAAGSFLGNDPWAAPAAGPAQVPGAGSYQPSRYAPPVAQAQQPQPQAGGGLFGGGGGSSFLGSVATTAAGVAAGGLLFQGLENLMGHHGGGGFGQGGFGQQPFGEQITEQTVVNNYYGDDAGQLADNSDYGNDSFVSDDSDFSDDGGDSDWS